MKNILSFSLCSLLCMWLTSCMGEPGNSMLYFRYGVATTEPSLSLLIYEGGDIRQITFPELNTSGAKAGDCFLIQFNTDFSKASTKGVHTVEMISFDLLPQHTLEETEELLPDTIPDVNEQFFTVNMNNGQFLNGHFFLHLDLKNCLEEQTEEFSFVFNADSVFHESEKEGRYYEFCLRAIRNGGTDTLNTTVTEIHTFNMYEYLKEAAAKEQEEEKDSIYFRFQYPNRVQVVSGDSILTWTQTALYGVRLSEID
ncbi:hypothetical protein LJC38_03240 [Parabacteroides sp. OttesenSCG-928-K15]|nr:hypothetical protein [Parabacteroides sp. OttesenSCG-928-K15]